MFAAGLRIDTEFCAKPCLALVEVGTRNHQMIDFGPHEPDGNGRRARLQWHPLNPEHSP